MARFCLVRAAGVRVWRWRVCWRLLCPAPRWTPGAGLQPQDQRSAWGTGDQSGKLHLKVRIQQ